jgi:hypothetical protein
MVDQCRGPRRLQMSRFKAGQERGFTQAMICSQKHSPPRLLLAPLHGGSKLQGVGRAEIVMLDKRQGTRPQSIGGLDNPPPVRQIIRKRSRRRQFTGIDQLHSL